MTIIFPDCSQYSGNIPSGYPFGWARASIGDTMDQAYATSIAGAIARKQAYGAYHFLNSGSLGVSAASQARFAYGVIGPRVPTFLDIEPNLGYCATVEEAITWIGVFRDLGGVVHLHYTPHWSWESHMGSPDLSRLQSLDVSLISSYYTTYSDNGPGWASYGGVTPVQWQFTNNLNGTGHDGNAYRGTLNEYIQLIIGEDMATREEMNSDAYWWDYVQEKPNYDGIIGADGNVIKVLPNLPLQRMQRVEQKVDALTASVATLQTSVDKLVASLAALPTPGGSLHVTGDLTLS